VPSGTGGEGSGGDPSCSAYLNEESLGAVTFRVRNDTAADIYLMKAWSLRFDLQPTAGPDPRDPIYDVPDSPCAGTCETAQKEGSSSSGTCEFGSVRIAAGGTLDVPWDGRGSVFVGMPSQCYAFGASTFCRQYVAATPGSYTIQMSAYQECSGECSCDGDGNCTVPLSGLSESSKPATFSFPQDKLVEVVFDACSFGCP